MTSQKKIEKSIPFGIVNIQTSQHNTIVSLSDIKGNVLCWCSAGILRFNRGKKATSYAARSAAYDVALKIPLYKMKEISIIITGHGENRDDILYVFKQLRISILDIHETIRLPHNGCRPPKRRRK